MWGGGKMNGEDGAMCVCPICKTRLEKKGHHLFCPKEGAEYPLINGIPSFIIKESSELKRVQGRYNAIFSKTDQLHGDSLYYCTEINSFKSISFLNYIVQVLNINGYEE